MTAAASHDLPPVEYVRLIDEAARLDGVIAIHSTARGPAAGGCRLWSYPDAETMLADAARLAEGMSYKNAMAELPFGGGKSVLRRPHGAFDRRILFEAFGREVEKLGGRYVTAEDVGTGVEDMEFAAMHTSHVAGRTARPGFAGGDPSPWTALGVFEAMKASALFAYGSSLSGMTIAVQGLGSVGAELCHMLDGAGARLVVADIVTERAAGVADKLGATVAAVEEIAGVDAQVFAPCALGGALDDAALAALKAKVVCGAANNQLAAPHIAGRLLEMDVTYAPDYVVNAGGIINVSAEYLHEDENQVRARVMRIGPRTADILEQARDLHLPSSQVANRIAEQLMTQPVDAAD
ncbi:Leu/Phe/Val dehydrogenase [Novosphingobium pentaromativorans]|uniref:Leucine dehydrogenase n=1 Tax=Novosphingobium pentaromativorans US6-1 TaxID=1088721 RepID=G6EG57_9SPHN|nr:Glu/Leu/Phe/Val dehydrogenase dimerization domain-containing protein [Novosphingobium pentaromativorans]AIT82254.1 amino acid dehydrogenase [Novosphingobium pentaromativorans US6-1]EHJ59746.1 leucine dehydrogenase [Novosphingobium pentaromativorans US6-1]